jgi:hypothetical protein
MFGQPEIDPVDDVKTIHRYLITLLELNPNVEPAAAAIQRLMGIVENPKLVKSAVEADFTPISLVNMPYDGNYRILGIKVDDNTGIPLALQTDWLQSRLLINPASFKDGR